MFWTRVFIFRKTAVHAVMAGAFYMYQCKQSSNWNSVFDTAVYEGAKFSKILIYQMCLSLVYIV